MLNLNHKKLDVYRIGLELVREIYNLTSKFPKSEIYGLTNQMRRAAVSIVSNIAEGSARKSLRDRIRFYEVSRSSLVEIDAQIEIAILLNFCASTDLNILDEKLNHLFAKLCRLIQKQDEGA